MGTTDQLRVPLPHWHNVMLRGSMHMSADFPYVQQFVWEMEPLRRPDDFVEAIRKVCSRHDAFRLRVVEEGMSLCLERVEELQFDLEIRDLSQEPSDANDAAIKGYLANDKQLNPLTETLSRGCLFLLPNHTAQFVWTSHHLLLDGRSRSILLQEIFDDYQGKECEGERPSYWEYLLSAEKGSDSSQTFWEERLARIGSERGEWFRSFARSESSASRFQKIEDYLENDLFRAIEQACEVWDVTANSFFQAAWALVLGRVQGEDTVVFGAPRANRHGGPQGVDVARLVGLLMKTVPVVCQLDRKQSVKDFVQNVREEWVAMREHEGYPIHELLSEKGNAVYDSVLSFESSDLMQNTPGLEQDGQSNVQLNAHTELPFTIEVFCGQRCRVQITFKSGVVPEALAHVLQESWLHVLSQMVQGAHQPLSAIELRTAPVGNNARNAHEPEWGSVHECFERVAEKYAEKTAVVSQSGALSYAELSEVSDRIAYFLRTRYSLIPGCRVALYCRRSFRLPALYLGILKIDCVYVPLSTEDPVSRSLELVEQLKPDLVISDEEGSLVEALENTDVPWVLTDVLWARAQKMERDRHYKLSKPGPVAYIMFTSGSTGKPKGVIVSHQGISRLVLGQDYTRFGPDQVVLHASATHFDASTYEVWAPLLNGGCCAVYEESRMDLSLLSETIVRHGVNNAWITASLFNLIVTEAPSLLKLLREVIVGGEALTPSIIYQAQQQFPDLQIINGYGPTENTTFSICYRIPRLETVPSSIPIGKPIQGTTAYVLDHWGKPLPPGVPGELCLGGYGLALGYWQDSDSTEKSFGNFEIEGQSFRLYHTGDTVIEREEGTFEFLGRTDDQAKVRGFRVEASEIQHHLTACPGVKQAAVLFHQRKETVVHAYVVATDKVEHVESLGARIREELMERAPAYMIPHEITFLKNLPLTPNGKIDTRSLPTFNVKTEETNLSELSSRDRLAKLWCRAFDIHHIQWEQSFLTAGGDSLGAIRFLHSVASEFGIEVNADVLYQNPTPAAFLKVLDSQSKSKKISEAFAEQPANQETSHVLGQKRKIPALPDFRYRFERSRQTNSKADAGVVRAYQLKGEFDVTAFRQALQQVVSQYESLKTWFHEEDGVIWQNIEEEFTVPLEIKDWTSCSKSECEARLTDCLEEQCQTEPPLDRAPIFRALLLRMSDTSSVVVFTFGHGIADGTSIAQFHADLSQAYSQRVAGETFNPQPEQKTFSQAAQEREYVLNSDFGDELRAYWQKQLEGMTFFRLPIQAEREVPLFSLGRIRHFVIKDDFRKDYLQACESYGISPFVLFRVAWQALACRYMDVSRVDSALIVNARPSLEPPLVFGDFVGVVYGTLTLEDDLSLRGLVERVKGDFAERIRYRLTRRHDLPAALFSDDDISKNPELGFCLVDDFKKQRFSLGNLKTDPILRRTCNATWRLHVTCNRSDHELGWSVTYPEALYAADAMKRLLFNFERSLQLFVHQPKMTYADYCGAFLETDFEKAPSAEETAVRVAREI